MISDPRKERNCNTNSPNPNNLRNESYSLNARANLQRQAALGIEFGAPVVAEFFGKTIIGKATIQSVASSIRKLFISKADNNDQEAANIRDKADDIEHCQAANAERAAEMEAEKGHGEMLSQIRDMQDRIEKLRDRDLGGSRERFNSRDPFAWPKSDKGGSQGKDNSRY